MKKILIVEDDELIRKLYRRALEKEGHEVAEASDGTEGFAKMFEGGYDLVLLDVMLPGMNGIDIIKKLKEEAPPKIKNKKVVMLTNLDDETVRNDSNYFGSDGYLVKNKIDITHFTDELKKYLE